MTTQKKIYTAGYEDATLHGFVDTLKKAGVETLIDVRAVPMSRKPGFSKNRLAERLAQEGIGYVSLKSLGTPAEGRMAARRGRLTEMRAIFAAHMETSAAVGDLQEAVRIAGDSCSCLLCFEAQPNCCHRSIVAAEMQRITGQEIEHLHADCGLVLKPLD